MVFVTNWGTLYTYLKYSLVLPGVYAACTIVHTCLDGTNGVVGSIAAESRDYNILYWYDIIMSVHCTQVVTL